MRSAGSGLSDRPTEAEGQQAAGLSTSAASSRMAPAAGTDTNADVRMEDVGHRLGVGARCGEGRRCAVKGGGVAGCCGERDGAASTTARVRRGRVDGTLRPRFVDRVTRQHYWPSAQAEAHLIEPVHLSLRPTSVNLVRVRRRLPRCRRHASRPPPARRAPEAHHQSLVTDRSSENETGGYFLVNARSSGKQLGNQLTAHTLL